MSAEEIRNIVLSVALLLAAMCLPFMGNAYALTIGVTIAMYTVLATSWALFSGPTHYISLATAAFFGVGAYVTGIGIQYLDYWVLLPIAGIMGAVLAALVGLATLRLSGVYFVIFTLGLAELVRQLHHVAPADDQVPAPLPRSLRKHVSERADHVAGSLGGVWCRIPHVRNVLQATSQPRLAQGRARAKHPAQGEPTVPDPRRALDRRGATPRRGGGV